MVFLILKKSDKYIQERNKWHQEYPNNLPPQQWVVGRVVVVHVGADGKVRVADVRTKDATYRRAVHSLPLLPVVC